MLPRNLLVFLLFLLLLLFTLDSPILVPAESTSFNFPFFTVRNFTLLGDSHLKNGVIGLTRETDVPSSSSGTLIYNFPIRFFDQESNITASFSTRFSFSIISTDDPSSYGDGLTFFLSPDNQILGSPGGYLGLANSSGLAKNNFLAVEFDTKLDTRFNDSNENHVGLDVNSLISIEAADAFYSTVKPPTPLLSVDIDLSGYLKDYVFVGFSASTEGSTAIHTIENWSFKTSGFLPVRPNSHPHNVSGTSVTIMTVPSSNTPNKHHSRLRLGLGIAGPSFFFVVLSVFGYVSVKKWKDTRVDKNLKAEILAGPREFSYKELYAATRGFHSSRIIGCGAFGNVYKAVSSSGSLSAVKRSKHSGEGKTEFLAELSIIAGLRHKNLVRLQGWCAEKGELLLVYEFMPNGSLDTVLHQDPENGILLTWSHRQNIAVGLASVLAYLHQECEQQVIHRDIKTSNIMLDGNFNPRLSDFGLARLMDHDKSPVSTLTAGTMGYLAPEYLQYGKATEKTDVFSYGVVILEGRIIEAADKRLNGEFKEDEMRKMLLIGLSCAHPDDAARPSIRRVLQILNHEADPMKVIKNCYGMHVYSLINKNPRITAVDHTLELNPGENSKTKLKLKTTWDYQIINCRTPLSTPQSKVFVSVTVATASFQFKVGGDKGWTKPRARLSQHKVRYGAGPQKIKDLQQPSHGFGQKQLENPKLTTNGPPGTAFTLGIHFVDFEYNNDSVLVVDSTSYTNCNVADPIFKLKDGERVFVFDRYGFFYFISGELGHCQAGQKLIVRVRVHPVASISSPRPAPSPMENDYGDGWDSFWGAQPQNSTIKQTVASYFMTALGGVLVMMYLLM
ncbi:putative L-type lectin-domain containing receptor kinase S.7 [Hibiscus syriacus]|uniref:non-specific serine/threonine protein kinase n=1 Tax=Hibiscus syriacus TaxID=106335 RepID=A0A6A3AS10_HIBSY|nr:putative L-type lectin-domain containing receptor kinase S.7 [Hibiscus syriacus]